MRKLSTGRNTDIPVILNVEVMLSIKHKKREEYYPSKRHRIIFCVRVVTRQSAFVCVHDGTVLFTTVCGDEVHFVNCTKVKNLCISSSSPSF